MRTWKTGKRMLQTIGNVQARVLLVVLYTVLMIPLGIVVRLLFDPLRITRRPTHWLDHPKEKRDLRWTRRQ
jgi:hypothetical protein